jgi:N-acyl-phosphatidylethanolamine-hydrolysing phospholipase D
MTTLKASATGAAVGLLFTASFSSPTQLDAVPEDEKNKEHHAKNGKGFHNPWASFKTITGPQIMRHMILYVDLHKLTSVP